MAVRNWVVYNGAWRCTATVWAIIPAPRHKVQSLQLDWWSGTYRCVQWVPGHPSGCGDWEIGARDGGPGGGWGRHAPLDWNSYCVHELAHSTQNTTIKCYPSIEIAMYYHVWVQINQAGFQSLKYMCYIHVIMIIKWFWLWLWYNQCPLCRYENNEFSWEIYYEMMSDMFFFY